MKFTEESLEKLIEALDEQFSFNAQEAFHLIQKYETLKMGEFVEKEDTNFHNWLYDTGATYHTWSFLPPDSAPSYVDIYLLGRVEDKYSLGCLQSHGYDVEHEISIRDLLNFDSWKENMKRKIKEKGDKLVEDYHNRKTLKNERRKISRYEDYLKLKEEFENE